ncbi:MAG: hypothetical protein EA341_13900, partial [Mongoliibacter sp.]
KGETGDQGIQGEAGEQGIQGIQGEVGPQGEKGDTGDQGQKGETGEQGIKGDKGEKGDIGDEGLKGEDGIAGQNGLSAYQIAVNNGFTGTEPDWLTSLEAAQDISGIAINATAITALEEEKAPLFSPTFTGTPTLPTGTNGVTQTAGNNSTALATTAFVNTAISSVPAGPFVTTSNVTSNSGGTLATDNFVFGSSQLANDNTTTDDDARMFFDKSKGAFRAGAVDSDQWNDAGVGSYSVAMGYNSEANADYSVGMGYYSAAFGEGAVALGAYTLASGDGSVAMGSPVLNQTTGPKASGFGSIALGIATSATGKGAFAFGESSTASGAISISGGYLSNATRNNSIAIGQEVTANSINEIVFGRFNEVGPSRGQWIVTDPLFTIGNGSSGSTNNAFQILKNGDATLDGNFTANSFAGDGSQLTGITATIADGAVTSEKILDGTIVDADISESASIDQSKIADLTTDLAAKAPVESPIFSGSVEVVGSLFVNGNTNISGETNIEGDLTATRYVLTAPTGVSAASTTTLDLSSGNVLTVNLGANITSISLSNAAVGTYLIKFIQDGTGNRTVAFPSEWKWSGGTVPTVTAAANKTDIVTLIYDGSTYYTAISQNF